LKSLASPRAGGPPSLLALPATGGHGGIAPLITVETAADFGDIDRQRAWGRLAPIISGGTVTGRG
jgi:hypothetical protein